MRSPQKKGKLIDSTHAAKCYVRLSNFSTKEVGDVARRLTSKGFKEFWLYTENRNLLCMNIPNYIILLQVFSYPPFQYTQTNGRGEIKTAAFIW